MAITGAAADLSLQAAGPEEEDSVVGAVSLAEEALETGNREIHPPNPDPVLQLRMPNPFKTPPVN